MVYRSESGSIQDTAWVAHTHRVLDVLNQILLSLDDAETAQRGYIITGKVDYLADYDVAVPRIFQAVQQVGELTVDNPVQQKRIPLLRTQAQARVAMLQSGITLRQQSFQAAQHLVANDIAQHQTDQLRILIEQMEGEERRLLQERTTAAQAASGSAFSVSSGGLVLSFAIILIMLNLIARESGQRAVVEDDLRTSTIQLQHSLQEMQRLTREMTLISTMSDLLQSCRTTPEAYAIIGQTMPQLFPQEAGALYLLNASSNLAEAVLTWEAPGRKQLSSQPVFSPDECWGLRRSRLHLVQGNQAGPQCQHVKFSDSSSFLCLPIAAHGETLGSLYLEQATSQDKNKNAGEAIGQAADEIQVGTLSEAKQQLARTAGEQISLSLANLKLQETLRTQSIRDPLSGLFNRRYLEASMEGELSRAQRKPHPIAVVMIDIDHFKRFNDTFGHEAGDLLLAKFAGLLKAHVRNEDIACRYGGEEFVLVLPELSLTMAHQRAEQLRQKVKDLHLEYRSQALGTVTISMGIAMFPEQGENTADLIRAADAALYRAKHEGRDRTVLAESPAGHVEASGTNLNDTTYRRLTDNVSSTDNIKKLFV